MKRNAALLIGGPLNGGIVTAMIWWVVNDLWKVGGVGLLARQPWPVSSIYACAGIGAATGLGLAIVLVLRRTGHADRVAALCQRLSFQYVRQVAREQLASYHTLRLFEPRRWHEAANLMTGRFDGASVELLDYEFVEHGDESTTHYRQTVALFPDCGGKLPSFELAARGLVLTLLSRVTGVEGITFEPPESASGWDRDAIERFRELYFLSPRMDEMLRAAEESRVQHDLGPRGEGFQPASMDERMPGKLEAYPTSSEAAIRRLFNVELLRFFADRPGWSIESDGTNLAVWRSRRIVCVADREEFLREADAIRTAIMKAAEGKPNERPLPGATMLPDPRSLIVGTGAWALGAFAGFIVGGAIGFGGVGLLIWLMKDPPVALVFSIFFGCPISGFVLGGAISYRWQRHRRAAAALRGRTGLQVGNSWSTIPSCSVSEKNRHVGNVPRGVRQAAIAEVETSKGGDGMITLTVDSRTIQVDCRPLAGTESANFRTRRLVRHDLRLVLQPSYRARLFAIVLLAIGVGFVAMGIALPFFWRDWPAELGGGLAQMAMFVVYPIVWLAALLFSGCGLLFLFGAEGIVLDRGTGRLHYVPKLKWRSVNRPLSDIVAVQFIRGAMHTLNSDNDPPYQSYQLNLVLDDPAEPRINLCDHNDVAWQFETGQEIAQFLGRPFLDLDSKGESASQRPKEAGNVS